MAGNALVDMFRVKELRERILYTIFWLLVFRLGVHLTIPGIDVTALQNYFATRSGGSGGLMDFLDFFAGGAYRNFSIFMLGVMPYISTQIIIQLMLILIPKWKKMAQEEGGRQKIQLWTRIITIPVCVVQGISYINMAGAAAEAVSPIMDRNLFMIFGILSVTVGTMFLIWIGEQITRRGIGNGVSIIIFAGIVARLPAAFMELVQQIQSDNLNAVNVIVVFAMFIGVVALVIYEQQGQRKIPVAYAKRVVGRKVMGGVNTYIPFKINPSGVIPVIFAGSILQMLVGAGQSISWLSWLGAFLNPGGIGYNVIYILFIVGFAYFYTQVSLNPTEIARQIRENGGSIPGIRSEKMEEYLNKILNRIILPGALYLGMIALIPVIVTSVFKFPQSLAYLLGGTSLIILVGVDLDTMSQINALLKMHHHDGLTKKGHLRGRSL
jgi:preprotein translocase subunit SecY